MNCSRHVSLEGETSVHPPVSYIRRHGGVFDEACDHHETWVKSIDVPSLSPLEIKIVDLICKNLLEEVVVVASIHSNQIFLNLGVVDIDFVNMWEENEVLHGKVNNSLQVHHEVNASLILDSLVRADEVYLGHNSILVADH